MVVIIYNIKYNKGEEEECKQTWTQHILVRNTVFKYNFVHKKTQQSLHSWSLWDTKALRSSALGTIHTYTDGTYGVKPSKFFVWLSIVVLCSRVFGEIDSFHMFAGLNGFDTDCFSLKTNLSPISTVCWSNTAWLLHGNDKHCSRMTERGRQMLFKMKCWI